MQIAYLVAHDIEVMVPDRLRPARSKTDFAPTGTGLLRFGVVGNAIVTLCCFPAVLPPVLGAVGFSAMLGRRDYVLLPGDVAGRDQFVCVAAHGAKIAARNAVADL